MGTTTWTTTTIATTTTATTTRWPKIVTTRSQTRVRIPTASRWSKARNERACAGNGATHQLWDRVGYCLTRREQSARVLTLLGAFFLTFPYVPNREGRRPEVVFPPRR